MLSYFKKRKAYLFDYTTSLTYTLMMLKQLEVSALNNPIFLNFCEDTFGKSSRDRLPYLIWSYINENIEYQSDYYDEELIAPDKLLLIKRGDCDDMALFAKTVLTYFGIKSCYIILGKSENEFTHILTIVYPEDITKKSILIDGTNAFDTYPDQYKFYKIIEN